MRKDILGNIECPNMKEKLVGGGLPSKDILRTAASAAWSIPKAPVSLDDIVLEDIPYKGETALKFMLRRSSKPGENRDVILMGTPGTVRQFVTSNFKSGDLTFSCAPKLFYQVF